MTTQKDHALLGQVWDTGLSRVPEDDQHLAGSGHTRPPELERSEERRFRALEMAVERWARHAVDADIIILTASAFEAYLRQGLNMFSDQTEAPFDGSVLTKEERDQYDRLDRDAESL